MRHALLWMPLSASLLLVVGCGNGETTTSTSAPRINVTLVDGPAPEFTALNLPIAKVEIRTSAGNQTSGWTELGAPNRTVNLLALRGGVVDELVKGAQLTEGRYQQLRLVLGTGATITLKNGTTAPLEVPSSLNSGLKIPLSFEVAAGTTKDIFIDFDGARSIQVHATGQNTRYILRPVLRAVDKIVSGSISGTLTGPAGPVAGALVLAQGADAQGRAELLRAVPTGADGKYSLDLLPMDRALRAASLPAAMAPQASPAITLTSAAPTATWNATLTATTSTGTLAGTVNPAPGTDQSDTAELLTTLNGATVIVATTPVTAGNSATFTFSALPAASYQVQVRRTTLQADGTRTSSLSPLSAATAVQVGQTSQVAVTFQ